MNRYPKEQLQSVVAQLANAMGVPAEDAALFAEVLVDADLHGVSTHGVSRLNIYLKRIEAGLIDPKAKLAIDRSAGSVLVLDAGNGLGQVQARKALDLLIPPRPPERRGRGDHPQLAAFWRAFMVLQLRRQPADGAAGDDELRASHVARRRIRSVFRHQSDRGLVSHR